MDPPRHACRGRPMVCTGPCNPLRTSRHHHHHHHHHRHHRCQQRAVENTTREEMISMPEEFLPISLLKSLKPDGTPSPSFTSTDVPSTSTGKIALIKITPVDTPVEPPEMDFPAFLREVLPPGQLELVAETIIEPPALFPPSMLPPTGPPTLLPPPPLLLAPSMLPSGIVPEMAIPSMKPELPLPTVTMVYPAPEVAPPPAEETVAARLSKKPQPLIMILIILLIYVGVHILLAVFVWRSPAYQFFVTSQFCGFLVFLVWRITGRILI